MPNTFAERVIAFNSALHFDGPLPEGIRVMNPFRENPEVLGISSQFYQKFYADDAPRTLILGINPGRLGAGLTGIPFTDTKRLREHCGLAYAGFESHEPSSVYVYALIAAYGGPARFYRDFYIQSACPLGFTKRNAAGRELNYNYYDSKALSAAVRGFIIWNLRSQLALGCRRERAYCLGTGKNAAFLQALNAEHGFFDELIALEHPRYIVQYKSKHMADYVARHLALLGGGH